MNAKLPFKLLNTSLPASERGMYIRTYKDAYGGIHDYLNQRGMEALYRMSSKAIRYRYKHVKKHRNRLMRFLPKEALPEYLVCSPDSVVVR